MDKVVHDNLSMIGLANTDTRSVRQLRERTQNWGFSKKRKLPEMVTALKLVVNSGIDLSNPDQINLQVRGRKITLENVLQYFQRSRHKDEYLEWIQTPTPGFFMSPDVKLLPRSPTNHGSIIQCSNGSTNQEKSPSEPKPTLSDSSRSSAVFHTTLFPEAGDSTLVPSPDSQDQPSIQHGLPGEFRVTEQTVTLAAAYCLNYFASTQSLLDAEPPYHHRTVHGIFGSQMQDGIFYTLHGTSPPWQSFNKALSLSESSDVHRSDIHRNS